VQVDRGARTRLEEYFRDNAVEYEIEHHPRAYTAREVAASEHVAARRLAKTVMVLEDGEMAMVVLPASDDLSIPELRTALGAVYVRLAEENEFAPAFPDCEVGAMPPLGNLYGLKVYVDEALTKYETIRFEAGTYTETMCIKYADFARLVQPTIVKAAIAHDPRSVLV
jgi:Ala-tRNA(Pro) deacylase